ncbi:hypothetical protein Tco_0476783 [Tanacetum coccineum]
MALKRATRSGPALRTTTTTSVTNAQLQVMIDQGVTAALAARDTNRNDDDNHTSGTGVTRCSRVHLPRLHEVPTSIFQRH